jgi:hypothetical protein
MLIPYLCGSVRTKLHHRHLRLRCNRVRLRKVDLERQRDETIRER